MGINLFSGYGYVYAIVYHRLKGKLPKLAY